MAEWMNDLQKKQWRTFTRNRIAVIGMFLSLGMLLMAVFAPQLSPFDPLAQDIHMRLHAPDGPFVLGTDDFGRDVLSRIFWGARISLTIGIGSVLFGMVLGSAMGMLAGLRGGRLGAFIMRCADTMMCFPAEILAILILVVLGQGVDKMLITIGLVMTPRFARLSYGSTLALREREFIEADLALGASTLYVLRQGILPNQVLLIRPISWASCWSCPACGRPPPSVWRPTSASSAWAFRRRRLRGATWYAKASNTFPPRRGSPLRPAWRSWPLCSG